MPEDELGAGADCIVDPGGPGPRIWYQVISDHRAAKNQLHLYIGVTGGRAVLIGTRSQRAGGGGGTADRSRAELAGVLNTEGPGQYAVAMKGPQGNESGIN